MKVCIITAVWKRPEVFEIFAEAVKSLDGDIVVCVAGSEGDKSKDMVEKHGFMYVETPNKPLGVKMNQAAILASQTGADYYLLMGSDDIMNQPLLDRYIKIASKGWHYIYLVDCYFYDTVSGKSLYWAGYLKNRYRARLRRALGCGRMLSKQKMERVRWQPWMNDRYHDLLDTGFDEKMRLKERESMEVTLQGDECILDIKSSTNMTPFAPWDNTREINKEEILRFFPDNITKLL